MIGVLPVVIGHAANGCFCRRRAVPMEASIYLTFPSLLKSNRIIAGAGPLLENSEAFGDEGPGEKL